jgi:hypothetical protein
VTRETLAERNGTTTTLVTDGRGARVEKRLAPGLANTEALEAALGVDNPHVARILSVETAPDGGMVACQEYVKGETLDAAVAARGAFGAKDTYAVALDLLDGLRALHAHGVLHRDVTPKNIVLSGRGAVLIDLGIARRTDPDATRDTRVLGTWGYAAPEQFGFAATDERSDLYSVGRVMLFMLSGRAPEDVDAATVAVLRANLPETMAALDTLCAFEPGRRCADADEAIRALRIARAADGAAEAPKRAAAPEKPRPALPRVRVKPRPLAGWLLFAFGLFWFAVCVDVGFTAPPADAPASAWAVFSCVFGLAAAAVPGWILGSALRGAWLFSARPCPWKRALVWLVADVAAGFVLLWALVIFTF